MEQLNNFELKAGSFYIARNNSLYYVAAIINESSYEYPLGFAVAYQLKSVTAPWMITASSPAVHYHRFGDYDPIEQPQHELDLIKEVFL